MIFYFGQKAFEFLWQWFATVGMSSIPVCIGAPHAKYAHVQIMGRKTCSLTKTKMVNFVLYPKQKLVILYVIASSWTYPTLHVFLYRPLCTKLVYLSHQAQAIMRLLNTGRKCVSYVSKVKQVKLACGRAALRSMCSAPPCNTSRLDALRHPYVDYSTFLYPIICS